MLDSCSEKYTKLYLGLSSLKDQVTLYGSHGGLFFWIKPLRLSCLEVCKLFIQHNIIISPGSLFTYSGKTDYFRLSIPHLTLKHIDEIIKLVELSL
jgi:DNA-binding transcriptional MocR family regulator